MIHHDSFLEIFSNNYFKKHIKSLCFSGHSKSKLYDSMPNVVTLQSALISQVDAIAIPKT
jgi:hypothetical protein